MTQSTLALITVPFFTGVIGYVTNWTGVLMLFYPVHFKGVRAGWLKRVSRVLPYKLQQIPGIMVGGIGWQGIIPSRAAKMGSLAVDVGIAKLGTPREFFDRLEPDKISAHIVERMHGEMREIVDRVMTREQPRLWNELPRQVRELVYQRVEQQLPEIVDHLTDQIAEHIDQLVDVKLMVIKRFDPELANRVFLDMGRRELKFIQNFGFFFGFALGIPVAALTHFVTFWWLLPILGVAVGYVTNWVALWMIYEPPEAAPLRPGPLPGTVRAPPTRGGRRLRADRGRRDHHRGQLRRRAAERAAVRPDADADRELDAAGHRPSDRSRPPRAASCHRRARIRVDQALVCLRAGGVDDGPALGPRVQPQSEPDHA